MFKRKHDYYKCKICHKIFELKKENRYSSVKQPAGGAFGALVNNPVTYDTFDCIHCGCQNIVNVREPAVLNLEPDTWNNTDAKKED